MSSGLLSAGGSSLEEANLPSPCGHRLPVVPCSGMLPVRFLYFCVSVIIDVTLFRYCWWCLFYVYWVSRASPPPVSAEGLKARCILASSFYPLHTSLQAPTCSPPLACLDYVPISAWASLPSLNAVLLITPFPQRPAQGLTPMVLILGRERSSKVWGLWEGFRSRGACPWRE